MQSSLISLLAGIVLASANAGPSDEMFEELKTAQSVLAAESVAEDILSALRESGSATADILLERARTALAAQETELARDFLDRAIVVQPDFSEAWFQRSLIYLNDGMFDQAIIDLNEALTHEPRNFRAWLTLGNVFESLGQNREALAAYREVLSIHPHHAGANTQIKRLAPLVDGRAI